MKFSFEEMKEILFRDFGDEHGDAIRLGFSIGGENAETAQRILYYYTGWQSFEGYLAEMYGEEED